MSSKSNLRRILLTVFIVIELGLLGWWLSGLDGQYDNEAFLLFQMILTLIGFPTTLVALVLVALVDVVSPVYAGHTKLAAVGVWFMLALAAYLQWFVWVPKLSARILGWWRSRSVS